MGEAVDIRMDPAGLRALYNAMQRAERELHKTTGQALQWGAYNLAKSLGASTKVAPKLRPLVKNPDVRAGTDLRVARWGVWKWNSNGGKYFKPLGRTGEYGAIKYLSPRHSLMKVGGRWEKFATDDVGATQKGFLENDKRRNINRRGLAKAAWMWGMKTFGKSPAASVASAETQAVAQMHVSGEKRVTGNPENMMVRLTNQLRYVLKALKGGEMDVSTAAARAAASMEHKISMTLYGKRFAG